MSEIDTQPLHPDAPVKLCAGCGQLLEVSWQPGFEEIPGYWNVQCWRERCSMWGYTLSANDYPPRNLNAYVETGRRRIARRAGKASV